MDPKDELEFYKDPENLRPDGSPGRRTGPRLTAHVPVRFAPETIAAVRRLAAREHLSVSNWIRRAVSRDLERLAPPRTGSEEGIIKFTPSTDADPPVTFTEIDQPDKLERIA
jgi:hypothetical protein